MTAPAPPSSPRRFFLPALGLLAVFALLGPAIGGAVFIPLAMLLEAQTQAAAHIGWIAGLIGHALALVPAYILGVAPAALAGLVYALYDAWTPAAAPRALAAALIGAVLAHGLYLCLIVAGAAITGWIAYDFGDAVSDVVYDWTSGEVDSALYQALIASGAVSAFVCASVARLIGLTMRG